MTDKSERAKLAVQCKGWRWIQGMLAVDPEPHKWTLADGSKPDRVDERIDGHFDPESLRVGGWFPDLDDFATQGCIEHGLLPDAYGERHVRVYFDDGDWWLEVPGRDLVCLDVDDPNGERRGDALAKALEAAPK